MKTQATGQQPRGSLSLSSFLELAAGNSVSAATQYVDRGGEWYWSVGHPAFLINIDLQSVGREMIWYLQDGNAVIWSQTTDDKFRVAEVIDQFNNRTTYWYAGPDSSAEITEIWEGGNKVVYVQQGGLLRMLQMTCSSDYTPESCVEIPELERQLIFDPAGKLLVFRGPENEYLTTPAGVDLWDLNNKTTNRLDYRINYDSQGFFKSVSLEDEDGHYRVLFTVEWGTDGRVQKIVYPSGHEESFAYGTEDGAPKVVVTTPEATRTYTYDMEGRLQRERVEQSTTPFTTTDTFREVEYKYLSENGETCPVVTEIIARSGPSFQTSIRYYLDNLYRVFAVESPHPNNDAATVTRFFEFEDIRDGGGIKRATDENGLVTECNSVFVPHADPQLATRRLVSTKCAIEFPDETGQKQTYSTVTSYTPHGAVDLVRDARGVVTKFLYAGAEKRRLLMSAVSGRGGEEDNVRQDEYTTVARFERNDTRGRVTALVSGPAGVEYRQEMKWNGARLEEVRDVAAGSRSNSYYTWDGKIAVTTEWSRDYDGNRFRDSQGVPTGADYYTNHYLYNSFGQLVYTLSDGARAPFSGDISLSDFLATRYFYNPDGSLRRYEGPLGAAVEFKYNGYGDQVQTLVNGTIVKEASQQGGVVTERVLALAAANGTLTYNTSKTKFNSAGEIKELTSPTGEKSSFWYNDSGDLTRLRVAAPNGALLSQVDVRHDLLGRELETYVTNPSSPAQKTLVSRATYSQFGLTGLYDQYGLERAITYDSIGRVLEERSGTVTQRYRYGANSNDVYTVTVEVAPGVQYQTDFEYYPDGALRKSSYRGNGSATTAPITTEYRYSTLGQLTYMRGPLGNELTGAVSPDGFIWWQKLDKTVLGRATRSWDRQSQAVTAEVFDGSGLKSVSVVGPLGPKSYTAPGRTPTQFIYDAALNLKSVVDAVGSMTIDRDPFGRVAKVVHTKGTDSIEQWIERDSRGLVEWRYEQQGGVTKSERVDRDPYLDVATRTISGPNGSTVISYDRNDPATGNRDFTGRIYRVTVNGLTQLFSFDPANRAQVVRVAYANPPPGVEPLIEERTFNGAMLKSTRGPGGVERAFDYGPMGWLRSEITSLRGAVVEQTEYQRDVLGRELNVVRTLGSSEGFGSTQKFDARTGNLTSKKDGVLSLADFSKPFDQIQATNTTTVAYDTTNPLRILGTTTIGIQPKKVQYTFDQLTGATATVNGVPLLTDPRGNITADGDNQYRFDPLDRLTQVDSSTGTSTLGYDIDGQLSLVANAARTDRHTWALGEIFSTNRGDETIYRTYSTGVMNQQSAQYAVGARGTSMLTTAWSHESPTNTRDGNGKLIESAEFALGGDPRIYSSESNTPTQTSATDRGFHGNLSLAPFVPGLASVRARTYNTNTQRFLSDDPVPNSAQTVNHSYPVYGSDKTGMMPGAGEDTIAQLLAIRATTPGERCHDRYSCIRGGPVGGGYVGGDDILFGEADWGAGCDTKVGAFLATLAQKTVQTVVIGAGVAVAVAALVPAAAVTPLMIMTAPTLGAVGIATTIKDVRNNGWTRQNAADSVLLTVTAPLGARPAYSSASTYSCLTSGRSLLGQSRGSNSSSSSQTHARDLLTGKEVVAPPTTSPAASGGAVSATDIVTRGLCCRPDSSNKPAGIPTPGCADCKFSQTTVNVSFSEDFATRLNRPGLWERGARVKLKDVATAIKAGRLSLADLPEITVILMPDGSPVTINNRGLAILKWATKQGVGGDQLNIRTIPWRDCPKELRDDLQAILARNSLGQSGSPSVRVGARDEKGTFRESKRLYTSENGIH
jgi:hypothetical protein